MIYPQIYFQIFGLFKYFKPATHLVILYADHDEFDHRRLLPSIDADTHTDIFRRSQQCGSFEKSCDKIAQSDGLALLAICSNDHRKSREQAPISDMPDIGHFICRPWRAAKIAMAAPGTPGNFRRSR